MNADFGDAECALAVVQRSDRECSLGAQPAVNEELAMPE